MSYPRSHTNDQDPLTRRWSSSTGTGTTAPTTSTGIASSGGVSPDSGSSPISSSSPKNTSANPYAHSHSHTTSLGYRHQPNHSLSSNHLLNRPTRAMNPSSHDSSSSPLNNMQLARLRYKLRRYFPLILISSIIGFLILKYRSPQSLPNTPEYLSSLNLDKLGWRQAANCDVSAGGGGTGTAVTKRGSEGLNYGWGEKRDDYVDLTVDIPETEVVAGIPGYNMLKNLYLHRGTFYYVTSFPDDAPQSTIILSDQPLGVVPPGANEVNPAGEDRWRVVTPGELRVVLGDDVVVGARIHGSTLFLNDMKGAPPKKLSAFLGHYFHSEAFLGAWRLQTNAYSQDTGSTTATNTPMFTKIQIGHATADDWRDRAGLTSWWLATVMPNTPVEEASLFTDRSKANFPHIYEKITIVDRWASHRHNPSTKAWSKMNADVEKIDAPFDWWTPIRKNLLTAIGSRDVVRQGPPVLTYINRQKTGRRLNSGDSDAVDAVLLRLEAEGKIELHNVFMEDYSRNEQFALAARTDIMLGVHGNGLTHQMWQKPGSVVIEMMQEGGFTRDYQIIAEVMRHHYYCTWNDHLYTQEMWEARPGAHMPEGFHGSNIRVDGEFMNTLLNDIITEKFGRQGTEAREDAL